MNPEIFNFRGKTLLAQGYFMEALMDFSVAIKLQKDRNSEKEAARDSQGVSYLGKKDNNEGLSGYYRNAG